MEPPACMSQNDFHLTIIMPLSALKAKHNSDLRLDIKSNTVPTFLADIGE